MYREFRKSTQRAFVVKSDGYKISAYAHSVNGAPASYSIGNCSTADRPKNTRQTDLPARRPPEDRPKTARRPLAGHLPSYRMPANQPLPKSFLKIE